MISPYLSIWEVAHRWRDINPDKFDSTDLPLEVQDALRYICRGILAGNLGIYDMLAIQVPQAKGGLQGHSNFSYQFVEENPAAIENCIYRKYDKDALNAYFVEARNLFDYCFNDQVVSSESGNSFIDYPSCWSGFIWEGSPSENEPDQNVISQQTQVFRPSQIDRQICQAIAKTMWDIHPTMTIAAMTEHKAILIYGNGKLYQGKNTLREWLSEVAPADVRKPGRPKKQ